MAEVKMVEGSANARACEMDLFVYSEEYGNGEESSIPFIISSASGLIEPRSRPILFVVPDSTISGSKSPTTMSPSTSASLWMSEYLEAVPSVLFFGMLDFLTMVHPPLAEAG